MRIETLLAEKPPGPLQYIPPDTTLRATAQNLIAHQIGALLVMSKDQQLLGIVSERDLVPVVANGDATAFEKTVADIMTRRVVTCALEDEIGYVLRLMNANAIRHIPILSDGSLVNMISIRELTRAYELLQVEANTDPLTEVSNRRLFMKTVNKEIDRAKTLDTPMTIAMIDLDHFKSVNDTYGHDAGDAVLRSVSDLLVLEFRSIDLIGRLGGEEFAIVFPNTDLRGAYAACERLRKAISENAIRVDGHVIRVTTSIGIASLCPDTRDDGALLKKADRALYQAKARGRNTVFISSEPLANAG